MVNQIVLSIYKETIEQTSNFFIYSSCLTLSAALASYIFQIKRNHIDSNFIET